MADKEISQFTDGSVPSDANYVGGYATANTVGGNRRWSFANIASYVNTKLGLGTMSTQDADAVAITDGTINLSTNLLANNFFADSVSVTSAGGTTTLTIDSEFLQTLTGSSSQNFQLPDATTYSKATEAFILNNNSSGSLVIKNNGGTTLYTVPAGGIVSVYLLSNSAANGTWDFHPLIPATVTWGSGVTGFVMNTALTTTPSISAGISSSTAPAFIPQRGSATTGYSGDSTHLYGVIGGVNVWSASAIGVSVPVDNALTAVGTTRADALQLAKQINNITTAASGTGVILPTGVVGMRITIFNAGANPIKIYANGSETIDTIAGSTGVVLTNAKRCDYFFVATNTWVSAQLGVVSA